MTCPGSAHILTGVVSRTGCRIFSAAAAVLDAMPPGARKAFADLSALMCCSLSPSRRRSVRANLEMAGPGRVKVLPVFRNHALNMIEVFASSRWDDEEIASRIEFGSREVLDSALAAGRGVILVTAHIGNWELPAPYLASLGYRLHVVAGIQMNRLLSTAVRREKERRGIEVIEPHHPYRSLFRALSGGGIVALLLDGDVYEGGVETEFFGRPVQMPAGAARLACRTGAPVVGACCRRHGENRTRIHMETILEPGEASERGVEYAQRTVFAALERFIRGNIDQWCIFRPIWKGVA